MSLFNSVFGSNSSPPKFRDSFEDPRARDHELSQYSSSTSPPIPRPVASTVLWSTPNTSLSPSPRVPDDLLVLQRRARHLEKQLQELLDAQADGLMSGLALEENQDDLVSNGSATPTASSIRSVDKSIENEDFARASKTKKVGLNAARRGIFRRIQQLASVKAEELDILDEDLRDLQITVEKTEAWTQKRSRLEGKIKDIEGENANAKVQSLQTEASKLEQEIQQKEQELQILKSRHRCVLNELADGENAVEAKLSTYKASLSLLNKEVAGFLARPPDMNHVPLSPAPFLSLPKKRRTLEMAHEYWRDEHARLVDKYEEVDIDRTALDEGSVIWNSVVKKVVDFEASLQDHLQQASRNTDSDSSKLFEKMDVTVTYLEEQLELASNKGWNLLVCAIGAELGAFKQAKDMLDAALGTSRKGKEKVSSMPVDVDTQEEHKEYGSSSAIRISNRSPPKPSIPSKPKFFDMDDEDPDPELMISHQDTDTD